MSSPWDRGNPRGGIERSEDMARATNSDIASAFREIMQILAIQGENRFRVNAYERAAEVVGAIATECCDIHRTGGVRALREIPGIGADLALKIEELCRTGRLRFLVQLRKQVPRGLLEVLQIEGVGPVKARFLWKECGVGSIRDLQRVLRTDDLAHVPGWGAQSVMNLRQALAMRQQFGERMPIGRALPLAEEIADALRRSQCCDRVEIAGSLRRRRETIGDLDLLAASAHPERVMEIFCALPQVQRVIARGPTKANVVLQAGIEADLRVLDPNVFGAALHYFTGSKAHNIATRKIAMTKRLTISEYGVFRGTKEAKGRLVACRTEADVFRAIGLPEIPPEIREDAGEIEAARQRKLPVFITERDLVGDLHCHSTISDGGASVEEMLAAAKRAGLRYVALTDHASVMGMVGGIKSTKQHARHAKHARGTSTHTRKMTVTAYVKRVRAAAKKVRGLQVLAGAEVDILADGSLYLTDDELAQLDWVVASIHSHFRQTEVQATARLVRAIAHPAVRCIGHPTTRLLGKREGMTFDWERVMVAATQHDVALELNASWMRLDLDDVRCRMARDHGVRIAINSDAHSPAEFDRRYGVAQAHRGWIERKDVINALPWRRFERLLQGT